MSESHASEKPVSGARLIFCVVLAVLWEAVTGVAFAQSQTMSHQPRESLEQEFTDPLTTLPQIFFKDTYSPANYGDRVQTNQLIARAIIPRIPPYTLLPFVQLIRPTFSLVTIPNSKHGTRTELGDTQLFDLAVPPWPAVETGFRLGLGPTFVFPTATSKGAGQGSWQAGPASPLFTLASQSCWLVSFYRIQSHSLTLRLTDPLRTRWRYSQPYSFISGMDSTCDPPMQLGCMVGVIIRQPCCHSAWESAE
jgi:hypothetical protein